MTDTQQSLPGPDQVRRAALAHVTAAAHPGWTGDVIEACNDLLGLMGGSIVRWTDDDVLACCKTYLPEQVEDPIFRRQQAQRMQRHLYNTEHITGRRGLTEAELRDAERTMLRFMHATDDEDASDYDALYPWEWCMRLVADGVPPLRARLYRLAGLPEAEARAIEAAGLIVERAESLIILAGLRGHSRIVVRGMAYTDPYRDQASESADYL